jgi:hypothetical protein
MAKNESSKLCPVASCFRIHKTRCSSLSVCCALVLVLLLAFKVNTMVHTWATTQESALVVLQTAIMYEDNYRCDPFHAGCRPVALLRLISCVQGKESFQNLSDIFGVVCPS